ASFRKKNYREFENFVLEFSEGVKMLYLLHDGRSVKAALIALLWMIIGVCIAQANMVISHRGGYDLPFSYKVPSMQGDTLHLYNYDISDRIINIRRGKVLAEGTIEPQSVLFSYYVDPDWGILTPAPLVFSFKNGKLYTAFKTDSKIIVLFTDDYETDVHVFDRVGIYIGANQLPNLISFYIVNESLGYFSHYERLQNWEWVSRIYKMDFTTDTLVVFYEMLEPDLYLFLPFGNEYILMYLIDSLTEPDLLVQNDTIIQTYAGGWGQYASGYLSTNRLCGGYFNTKEIQSAEGWVYSILAWVEDNELHRILHDYEYYPYNPVSYRQVVSHSDSTFSCIRHGWGVDSFQNLKIRNHSILTDASFPDLSMYNNPLALFRMDEQYMLAVSRADASFHNLTLVDFTDFSIRNFQFEVDGTGYGFQKSDRVLYMIRQNRVHIFPLSLGSSVDDNVIPNPILEISAFPNPFAEKCNLTIKSTRNSYARVEIFNVKGQKVRELYTGQINSGDNSFFWDSKDHNLNPVSSGLYFVRVANDNILHTRKILLLK
ncbi:MAG: T9SS type A sorting domain-containing protein, partial [Candidatus Cloacimonadaceae bacterium]|nr:T9SS type A sorting domain-containing protein [Candidatus Cloacimonadaceae bacterium]